MNISEAVTNLKTLAKRVKREEWPWVEEPQFTPPPTSEMLNTLASKTSFTLPKDTSDFFKEVDSVIGMSVHNGYWIGGVQQLVQMYERGVLPASIHGESCIPIATDGSGNTFLLSCSGKVWHFNHETKQETLTSNSFADFLSRVVQDWEAFVEDAPGWEYLV